jgi:hypothetical protein
MLEARGATEKPAALDVRADERSYGNNIIRPAAAAAVVRRIVSERGH